MDYIYALILGIVQGITEWLPISSTGHLILTERLLGVDTDVFNLTFDAAIQLGTTIAVIYYFREDLWNLVRHHREPEQRRLGKALVIATLPAIFFGLLFEDAIDSTLRALGVIAGTLVAGGLIFLWVERHATVRKTAEETGWKDALVIGLAQSLALVPGVSRSGSLGRVVIFDKRSLDAEYVRERESLVTRGYRRLQEIAHLDLPIIDYPLPEVRAGMEGKAGGGWRST